MKKRGILEYRKTRFVFYLFAQIVGSVCSNQGCSNVGSNKAVRKVVDLGFYLEARVLPYITACDRCF